MKKFNFAMLSAIALTGAMSFTACSSEDELANVNPTFDGENVKTNFTISVGDVKSTRMDADAVQADETFKGMTDIYLFPAKAAITETTAFGQGYINLPSFDAFDDADGTAGELKTAQAKRYKDVTFAIGTSHFLFYAATATTNKDNGELKPSYLEMKEDATNFVPAWLVTSDITTASTPANIKFDLVPYQKGKTLADVKTAGANTVKIVNDVYAKIKEQAAAATTASKTEIAAKLERMYTAMKNLNASDEPQAYAGSALSIQEMIEDIFNSLIIADADYATLTTEEKADYDAYYKPVIELINGTFTVTPATTTAADYALTWTSTNDFPKTDLGLPDGAVGIIFDKTAETFDYTEPSVDGMAVASLDKYTHPARLYYTKNTSAMVRNSTYLFTTDVTGKDWTTIQGEYADGAVNTATQSVIMKDQVEYAVGRLDARVSVRSGVTPRDAGSGIDGTADKDPQPVAIPAAGYKLTGVLIGGQKQVDWQFKPVAAADEMTIYDGHIVDDTDADITVTYGGGYSQFSHTLALETAENAVINIALEFENTGNDFYGINHKLIPAGSKFYLVARLDPTVASTIIANPNTLNQVFKQDYTTIASLTIGEKSLASAYNIIPDLRSSKLEFGLSVNLEWQKGIEFEQEF